MNLFSRFKRQKDHDIPQEMADYLQRFFMGYVTEAPDDMQDVDDIFAQALALIRSLSPKEAAAGLRSNHVGVECAVLNILQNCAMVEIKPSDPNDILFGPEDPGALSLYMAVNAEKLRLGYIDTAQYEANKRLGECLRYGLPPLM